jgi:hypothetical protein
MKRITSSSNERFDSLQRKHNYKMQKSGRLSNIFSSGATGPEKSIFTRKLFDIAHIQAYSNHDPQSI